jgi:hypothetical protein
LLLDFRGLGTSCIVNAEACALAIFKLLYLPIRKLAAEST